MSPPLEQWGQQWTWQRMLLYMQHCTRPQARQPPEVWCTFNNFYLPKSDLPPVASVYMRCFRSTVGWEVRRPRARVPAVYVIPVFAVWRGGRLSYRSTPTTAPAT